VLLVIAFCVVQWQAGVTVKMLVIAVGSLVVTLGTYELLIRRLTPLRRLFGMKPRPKDPDAQPKEAPRLLPSA
jgi:hypothetical protein